MYILLSKFEEDVVFEYHITVRDEDFNLGILTMRTPEAYLKQILTHKMIMQILDCECPLY